MRYPLLAVTAAALFALSACGSSSSDDPSIPSIGGPASAAPTTAAPDPTPTSEPTKAEPAAGKPATAEQARSTVDDVTAYAPALEQAFFSNGYPKDLAGAVKVARQFTNLTLSRGNTFGSYVFDPDQQEFKLCIENSSGAYAVYDTSPMTTVASGKSGGCP